MKNLFNNKAEQDLNDFIEEENTQDDVLWFLRDDIVDETAKNSKKKKQRKTLYAYLVLPDETFEGSFMDALNNLYAGRSFKSLNSIRKQLQNDGITDFTETKVTDNKYIFRGGNVVFNAIRLIHDTEVPVN